MKIIQPLRNLGPWYARQSRTVRDLIVMGAIGFPLYLLAVWYDTSSTPTSRKAMPSTGW